MAKIKYRENLGLSNDNKKRLSTINGIIDSYRKQGYIMTLRQLYYQLVSRDIISNNVSEYRKLSILLTKGRMSGIVDWSAIEDRGRTPKLPYWCVDVADALNDAQSSYRVDRQRGQDTYIEVWVEKDALSNIFFRVTSKYHVNLMVNKGYSSCTAMHEAYKRIQSRDASHTVIIYFGDHDPSGIHMTEDIRNRLTEFGLENYEVIRPALTIEQVRQYNLPDNPAKVSDPRAKDYIARYGTNSWELDALEPAILELLIEQSVTANMDMDEYKEQLDREAEDKDKLTRIIDNLDTFDEE